MRPIFSEKALKSVKAEFAIEPSEHREAHAHGFDARLFVSDGSITLICGDDRRTYGPGDLCSLPAGTPSKNTPKLTEFATSPGGVRPRQRLLLNSGRSSK
jgi:hypothetical protein